MEIPELSPHDPRAMTELARATILQLWELAGPAEPQIRIGFMLEVRRRGQPPYQTELKQCINHAARAALQPGTTLAVRVDPHNPGRVRLELGATTAAHQETREP